MKVFSLEHVLIIDDDPTSIFLTSVFIENLDMDIKIHSANSGIDGLQLLDDALLAADFRADQFLLLLDIKMPKMNGWQFLRAYADRFPQEFRENMTVIMLTTSSEEQDILKAVKSPLVQEFIEKPLSDDSLLTILEKYY